MNRKTLATLLVTLGLSGCAGPLIDGIRPPHHSEGVTPDRLTAAHLAIRPTGPELRKATDQTTRLQSVMLPPTLVESLVAVGPTSRARVMVGALFATRIVGSAEVAGLALVVQTIGGGLGPTLAVSPSLDLVADGEALIQGPVLDPQLYSLEAGPWGPVETVMLPIHPAALKTIAEAAEVIVTLGDSMEFELAQDQLSGFAALLAEIPEDTYFGSRIAASKRPVFITD